MNDDRGDDRDYWTERDWARYQPGALGYDHAERFGNRRPACAHERWMQQSRGIAECLGCGIQDFRTDGEPRPR